jgi:aspartate carbamoyltransferase
MEFLPGLQYLARTLAGRRAGMDLLEFRSSLDRPLRMKLEEFQREGRLRHLIFAAQLQVGLLDKLFHSADLIRRLSRHKEGSDRLRQLLSHKRAMLYFTQPSTRTFLSFMAACQILGITCNEVRDPKSSSEVKRESPMDSIRMFSSYFDVIIMRSPEKRFAECCAYLMNRLEKAGKRWVPIINSGSGADEHPTQSLLDVYTIQRTFQFDQSSDERSSRLAELQNKYPKLTTGPGNKTYAFCGDIGRGRTVRSLATVLAQYSNVKMCFISPRHPTLALDDALRSSLVERGVEVNTFESLDAVWNGSPLLGQIDCLYMTRIQREHNSEQEESEFGKLDLEPFRLTKERVRRLRDYCPILHPFPRDSVVGEIPPEIDTDPRAMYFRQARNGMWARAALLVHMFDVADDLYLMFDEFYPDWRTKDLRRPTPR